MFIYWCILSPRRGRERQNMEMCEFTIFFMSELLPVLLGVGVCRLPITVTMGPTGNVEGRWSDLHT